MPFLDCRESGSSITSEALAVGAKVTSGVLLIIRRNNFRDKDISGTEWYRISESSMSDYTRPLASRMRREVNRSRISIDVDSWAMHSIFMKGLQLRWLQVRVEDQLSLFEVLKCLHVERRGPESRPGRYAMRSRY